MKKLFLIFSILPVFFLATAHAIPTFSLEAEQSPVEFVAIGRPSALKIKGQGAHIEGELRASDQHGVQGTLMVNLDTFTTGIKTRDLHMKEKYLEVQKEEYKKAILTLDHVELPKNFWKNQESGTFPFRGSLTLHGKKNEVKGQFSIESRTAASLLGTAQFSLRVSDYDIQIPSFSGITMADLVDISAKLKMKVLP